MQDREFEKQVQQKMQELRFAPGADVWARVQADLRQKKRRRPVILWFLVAGVLLGGGYFAFTGLTNSSDSSIAQSEIIENKSARSPENSNQPEKVDNKPANDGDGPGAYPGSPKGGTTVTNEVPVNDQSSLKNEIAKGRKDQTTPNSITGINDNNRVTGKNTRIFVKADSGPKEHSGKNYKLKDVVQQERDAIARNRQVIQKDPPVHENKNVSQKTDNAVSGNESVTRIKNETTETVIKTSDIVSRDTAVIQAITNNDLKNQPASDTTGSGIAMKNPAPKKERQQSTLQFGISAGAGISDLGKQLLKGTSVADFAFGGGTATPTAPPVYQPSEVYSGAAFHVGGFVSGKLSKKLRWKAGLNYEYYSNRIDVGFYYGSNRLVNQGANLNLVSEYYTAGNANKFTNRFHFLSLPLSVQWQLNNNPKYGIIWENGVAPARLVNSDALHYDGISGTYYRDENLFNKTQWFFSSAVLFSVKKGKNVQLYAGPQVNYGIGNLLSSDADKKHLRYAGVRLMAGFNK